MSEEFWVLVDALVLSLFSISFCIAYMATVYISLSQAYSQVIVSIFCVCIPAQKQLGNSVSLVLDYQLFFVSGLMYQVNSNFGTICLHG